MAENHETKRVRANRRSIRTILILILLMTIGTASPAEEVYLFLTLSDDGDLSQEKGQAGHMEIQLKYELKNANHTVNLVDKSALGGQDVEEYVQTQKVTNFIHVTVFVGPSGLILELEMVTPKRKESDLKAIGTDRMKDSDEMTFEFQRIARVYEAMLDGYGPGTMILISCFESTSGVDPDVVKQLSNQLKDTCKATDLAKDYWVQDIASSGPVAHCSSLDADKEAKLFDYVLDGIVKPVASSQGDTVQVEVKVYDRAYTGKTFKLVSKPIAGLSVAQELAGIIAECWDQLPANGCQ